MTETQEREKRALTAAVAALVVLFGNKRWPERLLYLATGALIWWGLTGSGWTGAALFFLLASSFVGLILWSIVMYGGGTANARTEIADLLKAKVAAGEMCTPPNHVPVPGGGLCLCGFSYTEPVQDAGQ